MLKRIFVYEIRKKLDPHNSQFYCYLVYDLHRNKIVGRFNDEDQRIARHTCDEFLKAYDTPEYLVIRREWPLHVWPKDMNEEYVIQRIRNSEIVK